MFIHSTLAHSHAHTQQFQGIWWSEHRLTKDENW